MFNLIMQYNPWPGGSGSMPVPRFLEYTSDALADRFLRPPDTNVEELIRFPCLFMSEGVDNQMARIGSISQIRISGRDAIFNYTFDPEVPPIENSTIFANRLEFDMPHEFEFSRSHWAVKDVDLFRVLMRLIRPRRQRPKVFSIAEHERIEAELVSVMMPFDTAFDEAYKAIQSAAGEAGLRCRRADEIWEAPAIIQDVVSLIDRSRVVIADCTGRNPNVFYEIGIAHTLGREVLPIAQNESDIPFDLRHLRHLQYLNNTEGRTQLKSGLAAKLRSITGNQ